MLEAGWLRLTDVVHNILPLFLVFRLSSLFYTLCMVNYVNCLDSKSFGVLYALNISVAEQLILNDYFMFFSSSFHFSNGLFIPYLNRPIYSSVYNN